jgi:uncharacterized protein with FMN-binding domain
VKKALAASASIVAVAFPTADGVAAKKPKPKPKKTVKVTTKSYMGPAEQADRWGPLQVIAVIRTTRTKVGSKTTSVRRRIAKITVPVYPDHSGRSLYINNTALPWLIQEALQAQSANVQMISGATYSSEAFVTSLQGALALASFHA